MSSIRDFVPLAKLGEGTFSTVYKVRRLSDQKIYALKKVRMNNLSQKQKENALNQIRILASFQHNNIIAYKQAFFDDKLAVLCIVMEYADAGDLHKYISDAKKDYRRISQITIWKVAADILGALDHLHTKGILHRDLKCANIFIHQDQYKLGDLNVSKVNGGKLAYTQTGTPYYASPQVWRDQPYDNKSDIWSFGCILYQMACLRPPFQGKNMDQLYQNVQKKTHSPIPQDYSSQLSQLIQKCLQKNPKNRPKASQLLQHNIISKFKSRKNAYPNQSQAQKQLLSTIKVPSDLRALKMNLPQSKYQDKNNKKSTKNQSHNISISNNSNSNKGIQNNVVDIKNFISDRPHYVSESSTAGRNNQVIKNQSLVINKKEIIHSPRIVNYSQIYSSPKRIYQNNYLNRSPEDLIAKKIANAYNSQKKIIIKNAMDFTQRRDTPSSNVNNNYSENYSQRKLTPSQIYTTNANTPHTEKKNPILEKYDKFIKHQLEKKPATLPRTQKRVASSQGRYQTPTVPTAPISIPSNKLVCGPTAAGQNNGAMEKREIQQWKKKLVKKSRVFSNNIFGNKVSAGYAGYSQHQ